MMFSFSWAFSQIINRMVEALAHPAFWIVVGLVALQYSRVAAMRRDFLGTVGSKVATDTALASLFGFAGGVLGSIIMLATGLTINGLAFYYLLFVAVALMLIHPRFLCFSYAGGLLALSNLIFGFPEIDIPQVMALVAILHFVEAALIFFGGHIGAVPAYVRLPRIGVVGAFTLQRFWPIPVVALVVIGSLPYGGEAVRMPDWWPLIPTALPGNPDDLIYMMIPVVAALGYSDICVARTPAERSRITAVHLFGFSLVLFVLAYLAARQPALVWLAALWSPLGHELTIHIGKIGEFRAGPRYVPSDRGLVVLDVERGSPAWNAGVRSGDIVVEVNGVVTRSRSGFELATLGQDTVDIAYLEQGDRYRREVVTVTHGKRFGLLPVPDGNELRVLELRSSGLTRLWKKLKR